MEETRYMISDAAKKVEVEAHVLRYWEEELELPIARNELGHRYYTGENIQIFQSIKELKERGFQLKAIKVLLPEIMKKGIKNTDHIIDLEEKLIQRASEETMAGNSNENRIKSEENHSNCEDSDECEEKASNGTSVVMQFPNAPAASDHISQFQAIMDQILEQALQENNKELAQMVSESVEKEMKYLLQIKEEREEERYRQLDAAIRARQKGIGMAAATKEQIGKRKFFRFRRKKKSTV
ncbi:MAG: helix-turn-helix domain-containing protein [Lachnospiraceae bacterium]|nr:helix-turn-helix domain-containing protein [Robinsoniella sp.]MDY3765594.1 helix-turn-helix domain-containing protein [Lachnospiraceae bacterium]